VNPTRTIAVVTLLLCAAPASAAAARAERAAAPVAYAEATTESTQWARTIERVADSIVTIRVDMTRAFDTEWNATAQATGFVVDAERGLILTNRHVVTPGPVIAQAIFRNKEEVELTPLYRDPVHDFGVYRYDPAKLRFNQPKALPLHPERATVGREIRVIGNDAGEQLSILQGTLARLDREAPEYGRNQYNDWNTFYIQAASGTSGGSSGAPVVDIDGKVVALNAGARQGAQSSFYLPLGRVVRALDLVRKGEPVARGTLQAVFLYKAYDELKRLGLRDATEDEVRKAFPQGTGMLVVDQVVPGGSGEKRLEVGDVVVRLDGALLTQFIPLEERLDAAVGRTVRFGVERGGRPVEVEVEVRDLHAITPAAYLELGGAVLHDLSYQIARHLNRAPTGVYVANPGYMLATANIPRGALLISFDGTNLRSIAELREMLARYPDGAQVTVRYATADQPGRAVPAVITIDRRWYAARACRRDDRTGLWPCEALTSDARPVARDPAAVNIARYDDKRTTRLARSLVFVNFDMPYQIDGIDGAHYFGTGLIVDAAAGLVVVDRNTVPVLLGDVRLTFGGSLEIPGRVVYLHPLHNLAVIAYDPGLVAGSNLESAELAPGALEVDDAVWAIGFRADQTLATLKASVKGFEPVDFPLSPTFRFRESNLESIELKGGPEDHDGVLADAKGRIVGLWSSFAFQQGRQVQQTNAGVPAALVREVLGLARGDRTLRSLEVELAPLPLATARKLGLSEAWASRIEALDPEKRRVLQVERLVGGSPAAKLLREGDLLLSIDGATTNRMQEVERLVQRDAVALVVLRDGAELELHVPTVALALDETDRLVQWSGALLARPHRVVAAQRGLSREGVFVGYYSYGSPASRYGLSPGRRIVAVDDQPTPDLDAFLAAVAGKQHRESVRLKTLTWSGAVEVITLKTDLRYWPTLELQRGADGSWTRPDR
jgi:S1-C subfamily serine protease